MTNQRQSQGGDEDLRDQVEDDRIRGIGEEGAEEFDEDTDEMDDEQDEEDEEGTL